MSTETKTAEDVGNQHGLLCPKCNTGTDLTISATMSVQARLLPEGCDEDGGDIEWEDDSPAHCACGWDGIVSQLKTVEVSD